MREELARGGMGVVYRVYDRVAGEERALKRVLSTASHQSFLLEAFEREFRVLSGLKHPRIIRVYDFGRDELGPYYTMELLAGEDLRKTAPIPFREACLYLRDVATSLSLLHARHLLHRDISPNNVRKTPDGHCKLLDFGALHAFGPSDVTVGTPPAISPEAVVGAPLDQRSDLYALGALGYFLLTGRHAYPADTIDDLPSFWDKPPSAPSTFHPEIPRELDLLILSLLSYDALARPSSAGEVIARVNTIASLPAEEEGESKRLAQSFLSTPRFIGRRRELADFDRRIQETLSGKGSAVRIEAISGSGRTRLLEEVCLRAQMLGATAVRVDANTVPHPYGTVRAVARRLFEALPSLAERIGLRHPHSVRLLARQAELRNSEAPLRLRASDPPVKIAPHDSLENYLIDIARERPLVIAIDNIESIDGASLAIIATVAKQLSAEPILLVVTERSTLRGRESTRLAALNTHCTTFTLDGFSAPETLQLVRSMFGDAPNVERFAEWLHDSTAGSPLHCLETTRQLLAQDVVRHMAGLWVLPIERPDNALPAALEDALSVRLSALSVGARDLAECLSLQRQQPTWQLCLLLHDAPDLEGHDATARRAHELQVLLDELAREDVMLEDHGVFRFSNMAIREALLADMEPKRKEHHHRQLGEAFLCLAHDHDDIVLKLEAGFHLIQGGDEMRGADLIALISSDSFRMRTLVADLYSAARPCEAALRVYKHHRRSVYARMPLLAALGLAGYYESRSWGDKYGDEALDALEDMVGLQTAARVSRVAGKAIGLIVGLMAAWIRFMLTPRRDRPYSFREIFVQLLAVVTALTGTAAMSLDSERAERVASVLAPFSIMPQRTTPRGIYDFCLALAMIGRERVGDAFKRMDLAASRFQNPNYYPTLPADGRHLMTGAAHFARGAVAIFRDDSTATLESADALETTGFKLYALIASQLRYLYHMNRGEVSLANRHREQVELHAAHVGSAWQVEIWEATALTIIFTQTGDIIGLTHLQDRLGRAAKHIPSLKRYHQLASIALCVTQSAKDVDDAETAEFLDKNPDRSYIGWGAHLGYFARALNECGRNEDALAVYARARSHLTPDDAPWVSMFLQLELEFATAEAALGRTAVALGHLKQLQKQIEPSEHPLALGLIAECQAKVAIQTQQEALFIASLQAMEARFRPTENPLLVARCEHIATLGVAAGYAPESAPRAHLALLPRAPSGNVRSARRMNSESAAQTARVTRPRSKK